MENIKNLYIEYLQDDNMSNTTITNYLQGLKLFFNTIYSTDFDEIESIKEFNINKTNIDIFHDSLKENLKSGSIKLRLNSLISFIKFLDSKRLIEDGTDLIRYIKAQMKKIEPDFVIKEILTETEIKLLFDKVQSCKQNKHRKLLMIFCMCQLGMRRKEVVNLKLSDIFENQRKVRIFGKGNKYRMNTLNDKFFELYNNFLELERSNSKYAEESEYIFISQRADKMTENALYKDLEKAYALTGLTKHLYPHMLRRSYASILYKKGISIFVIQKLLGHSSEATTRLYFAIDEEDMKDANNIFDIF